MQGAKEVTVEDPYIRWHRQVLNFVRLCETIVKVPSIRRITLITVYDGTIRPSEIQERTGKVKQSLTKLGVLLDLKLNPHLHDREIRLDNGWVIKIGRGLDFFQKPDGCFGIGSNDLSLRKCLETKVDIYKVNHTVRKR